MVLSFFNRSPDLLIHTRVDVGDGINLVQKGDMAVGCFERYAASREAEKIDGDNVSEDEIGDTNSKTTVGVTEPIL